MKTFLKMTLTELKLTSRNIVFVISTILLPLLLIMLFGGLYGNDLSPNNLRLFGMGAVSASAPAYLALALGIIAFTGMPQHIVGYKENKILKRLKATPIKKYQILLPIFANFILLFLVGMCLLFTYALVVFDVTVQGNVFAFVFAVALSVAAMFSLGFLLSCLCKTSKQVTAIGFAILLPVAFLSGTTMPIGAFPQSMENISKAVPLTYCVEFMKNTFTGAVPFADNAVNIIVLSAITIVCGVLSFVLFRWE
jgi:ABC-2 type transport system permease protein